MKLINNKLILSSVSIVAASFVLSGCTSNLNTNLEPEKKQKEMFDKKDIEKDKSLINVDNVSEMFEKQRESSLKYGVKEEKVTTDDRSIVEKIRDRKILAKEKLENYLTFKKEEDKQLSFENITLNLNNVPVQEAFKLISDVSKKNIVLGDEIDGNINIDLFEVPWNQALDTVLKIKGFVKYIDGDIIRIHKPENLKKLETFERERIKAFKEETNLKNDIEPLELEIFKLYYTETADVKKQLEDLLNKISKEEIGGNKLKITEDTRTRSLIIEATPTILDKISKIIKNIDVRTKQVLIEAFIVEASDNFSEKLESGLGVNFQNSTSGIALGNEVATTATNPGFGSLNLLKNISSTKLSLELNALETKGFSKTVANPKFFTMNNETASVMQGSQLAYVTKTSDATQTIFKDAVLKLEATPSVIGDGNIILNILVTKDRPEKLDVSAEPSISKMEIKTKLLLEENTVAVIGGVYEENEDGANEKTPLLGDVPLLGNLFTGKAGNKTKKELLIFITAKSI